jgi:hypothetical protein
LQEKSEQKKALYSEIKRKEGQTNAPLSFNQKEKQRIG